MRDAIGSTWVFALVLSFTFIFTGFLVLSLTYSKAYKIKNEVTSMIEKYEGLTTNDTLNNKGSIEIIHQYLDNSGYNAMGTCQVGEYASDDLKNYHIVEVTDVNKEYYYCISKKTTANCKTIFTVTMFYDFNLPILGDLRKYSISGQTTELYKAYLNNSQITC